MTPPRWSTRLIIAIALVFIPASSRSRRQEEWLHDLQHATSSRIAPRAIYAAIARQSLNEGARHARPLLHYVTTTLLRRRPLMNLGIMGTAGTLILTVLTTLNGSTPNHEVTDDNMTEVTRGNVTFIYTDPSPYDLDPTLDPCDTSVGTTQDPAQVDEDEDSMIHEDPLAGTPAGSEEEEYGDALPEDWPTEVPEWVLRQYEECPPWNGAENS